MQKAYMQWISLQLIQYSIRDFMYYVLFIIRHKTREIIQFGITMNPVKEFVRQQIIDLTEDLNEVIYLIFDNAGQFMLNYIDYGIKGINISVRAPNMNAIAERFVGSIRREILDSFIIINKNQLINILKVYIEYYNKARPHQGIEQRIPKGHEIKNGEIKSRSMLFGLNQEFYR